MISDETVKRHSRRDERAPLVNLRANTYSRQVASCSCCFVLCCFVLWLVVAVLCPDHFLSVAAVVLR